jgi:hypothetical protein
MTSTTIRTTVAILILLLPISVSVAGDAPSRLSPFTNYGLGGGWVAVARNGTGFQTAFRRSVHVCNAKSDAPIEIASEPVTNTSAPPPWSQTIPAGTCGCVPHPASVFAHSQGAAQIDFLGTYEWMSAKACDAAPKTPDPAYPPFAIGTRGEAPCKPLKTTDGYYSASCQADLPKGARHARLCFDKGWVNVAPGFPFQEYASGFVNLIVDPNLLTVPAVQYDIRWSYVTRGCIDIAGAKTVWFVVHGDSNYDSKYVKKIVYYASRAKAR